jgi:hypothetical protein
MKDRWVWIRSVSYLPTFEKVKKFASLKTVTFPEGGSVICALFTTSELDEVFSGRSFIYANVSGTIFVPIIRAAVRCTNIWCWFSVALYGGGFSAVRPKSQKMSQFKTLGLI